MGQQVIVALLLVALFWQCNEISGRRMSEFDHTRISFDTDSLTCVIKYKDQNHLLSYLTEECKYRVHVETESEYHTLTLALTGCGDFQHGKDFELTYCWPLGPTDEDSFLQIKWFKRYKFKLDCNEATFETEKHSYPCKGQSYRLPTASNITISDISGVMEIQKPPIIDDYPTVKAVPVVRVEKVEVEPDGESTRDKAFIIGFIIFIVILMLALGYFYGALSCLPIRLMPCYK